MLMLDGKKIFELMDTYGLPLEIINLELRKHQLCFNVVEFIEAALASKNFTYNTIKRQLLKAMPPEYTASFIKQLDAHTASNGGWVKE